MNDINDGLIIADKEAGYIDQPLAGEAPGGKTAADLIAGNPRTQLSPEIVRAVENFLGWNIFGECFTVVRR